MKAQKATILFLCTGNSCRSQMAEAWTRHLKSDILDPFSAGVSPTRLDPLAVTVMQEVGIDISAQQAKEINQLSRKEFDYVITVCNHANESCPFFPGKIKRIHKNFDDPPRLTTEESDSEKKIAVYRQVRDEIRAFVETFPGGLDEIDSL